MPNSEGRLLPGLKPVLELLQSNPERITRILVRKDWRPPARLPELARKNSVPIEQTPPAALDKLCGADQVSHQGVVAVLSEASLVELARLLELAPSAPLPLIIAMDQVRDPGNLGAISRTAWAMGCAGMIVPRHNSASLGPGALRSSAGALAKLPVCPVTNLARSLDTAEESGFSIYGAGCGDEGNCENIFHFEWQLPAVLVMGSEARGIRQGVARRCSKMLHIPLARSFDSLNVAQASAIIIAFCAAK